MTYYQKLTTAVTALTMSGGILALSSVAFARNEPLDEICARAEIECLASANGVVIGTPQSTKAYAGSIEHAAGKFETYFGEPAPKAALILGDVLDRSIKDQLRPHFPVVMPWLTLSDRRKLIAHNVRRQVLQQQPNLEEATLEKIVEQSVNASLNASGNQSEDLHLGVLAHELGHLFFIRTFWPSDNPDADTESEPRYGGPAADWLDEMAAVLMENGPLTKSREKELREAVILDNNLEALWPLGTYFTMEHPAFRQAQKIVEARRKATKESSSGKVEVVILSKEDIEKSADGRDPSVFYAQSRGFADFMIQTTGNPHIFAVVARHIAAGGTMESWLKNDSQAMGLPADVSALQTLFEHWLMQTYSATTSKNSEA